MVILQGLEIALFVWFAINVAYLLIFSLAALRSRRKEVPVATDFRRIVILIPAYREDRVIMECVESCLVQNYPRDHYEVVVISDQMSEVTNAALSRLPIRLEVVHFRQSTKAKALNLAMSRLDDYELGLVLDADNTVGPDFLQRVNAAFNRSDVSVFQAHRVAKNRNTHMAYLDAVSEEINNSIFRQGHVNLGLSAALIGSGMVFDYRLLKEKLASIRAVGGFDRALELTLFKEGKRIGYLPDAYVLDEKIQTHSDFSRQRRRWLSAQYHYLTAFFKDVPRAVSRGQWDFCDKMFQQMSIPRIILLGLSLVLSVGISFLSWSLAIKWWILSGCLFLALALAIPRSLYTWALVKAMIELPLTFGAMFLTLFRLKGANRSFIHTQHGIKELR